jgi:hypothetical protein
MSRRPKTPALKILQFTLRALQLTCSIILLSLDSYLLAALSNHGLSIPTSLRAAEGVAGITVAYVIMCILALRFSPHVGRMLSSFATMALDVTFASATIYLATTNGYGGAGKCGRDEVDGPFGKGKPGDKAESKKDGFVAIPTYGDVCRVGSAGLAVSVVLIFLFLGSVFTELWLGRNYQRDKRLNLLNPPDEYDHSKLAGADTFGSANSKKGFFGRLFSRRKPNPTHPDNVLPEHALPEHTQPVAMGASSFGSGAIQDDRQPLTRPQPTTPNSSSQPDYYTEEEDIDLSGRNDPSYPHRPLTYPHGSHGSGHGHQSTPYGEVPDAGGDLGYGLRNSMYGDHGHQQQPAPPYPASAPYDDGRPSPYDNHDDGLSWRPSDRFVEGGRRPSRSPPGYRYGDGVFERV